MTKKKLIHCKSCDAEIAASAKTCPHCGAKNKKPLYKKAWFWILIVLLLIGFVGGGEEKKEPVTNSSVEISTPTENPAPSKEEITATETTPATESVKIRFEPLVAVDNEHCKIMITGIDPTNIWGYTIKAELENKSTDKTFMFSTESCSINGVQCETLTAKEVAPGKKAIEDIILATATLDDHGIKEYSDIEIAFRVYNNNDWTEDPVARETINLYPLGKDKATIFVREPQGSDIVLFENNDVKATVIGTRDDSIWGYTLDVYLENKTSKTIMFAVNEASVNGYMADPFFAREVAPGKCKFTSISWNDTALEEIGITDINSITNIEFNIRAYDSSNWTGNDYANETVTLNP